MVAPLAVCLLTLLALSEDGSGSAGLDEIVELSAGSIGDAVLRGFKVDAEELLIGQAASDSVEVPAVLGGGKLVGSE